MTNAKTLAAAIALAVLLAACGSDSDDADSAATETDTAAESTDAETDTDAATEGAGADDEAMTGDAEPDDEAAMADDESMSEDDESMSEDDESMSEDGDGGDDTARAAASQTGHLAIVSIDFSTAEVELTNTTDTEIDINGWVMCNFPSYAPISGVDPIGPGETVTITSTVAIPSNDGELAIYTAEDFTNPDSIVTYVQWGSDDHTRSSVATAAGIWEGPALTPDGDILTVGG